MAKKPISWQLAICWDCRKMFRNIQNYFRTKSDTRPLCANDDVVRLAPRRCRFVVRRAVVRGKAKPEFRGHKEK